MTFMSVAKLNEALSRAERHAPHLRQLMGQHVAVRDLLAAGDLNAALALPDRDYDSDMPVGQALRRAKGQLALAVAIGDLSGVLDLEGVTLALSDFADTALDRAITAAISEYQPGAPAIGLAAIALGKHGSRELNYSSDIDPILIFDPETLPRRTRDEPVEAAVRMGRRIVELMQARTEHGYVFRIDLRLRPTPEVTPIVMPVDAAITYYESQAVAWERAAFIRARACSGDLRLGQYFTQALRPFVWRRGLDFGAVRDIRAMSHRIRDHYAQGQRFGPGFDLKRGRGGIRECEFFAQIHQLIHGGRDADLRAPSTIGALNALAAAGHIPADTAQTLSHAYRRYREIEHRLQMVDDQQTHSLPRDAEALDNVAQLAGLDDGQALLAALAPDIAAVGTLYDSLDGPERPSLPSQEEALETALRAAGFVDPTPAIQRIQHWRSGAVRAVRTPAAHEALEAVLPQLIEGLGHAPDPLTAINQFSTIVERLPSAINLFRLLEARPALLAMLADILCHAPTLAEQLGQRPAMLDRLIDASAFDPPGSVDDICGLLSGGEALEDTLDHVRHLVGEMRFALGVQLVGGVPDALTVAGGYARIAEAAIRVITDATIAEFEKTHGRVPGGELVILALGRMGGAELTHASDLDLIYLFTGDFSATSDGAKPLGAVHYFNRLSQRVTNGLSVPTAAGALYDVDTRLRPSGSDGPLAISLDSFARYQRENAWTWEHMALTRARPVYGSPEARAAAQTIITSVLTAPRDRAQLITDAAKMRRDMAAHKPPLGPLDVKLASGGLVDLEFLTHVLQLAHGKGLTPLLGTAIAQLVAEGLMPSEMQQAHALLTRTLVAVRLMAPSLHIPSAVTRPIIAQACGTQNWPDLLAQLETVRQSVAREWGSVIAIKGQ
jgi:glutamate-ammonia-ligase adenylyltransferase